MGGIDTVDNSMPPRTNSPLSLIEEFSVPSVIDEPPVTPDLAECTGEACARPGSPVPFDAAFDPRSPRNRPTRREPVRLRLSRELSRKFSEERMAAQLRDIPPVPPVETSMSPLARRQVQKYHQWFII